MQLKSTAPSSRRSLLPNNALGPNSTHFAEGRSYHPIQANDVLCNLKISTLKNDLLPMEMCSNLGKSFINISCQCYL